MWPWPEIELTDYERKFVRPYPTAQHAGVLKRVYEVQLTSVAQPASDLPNIQLTDQIQIARRSRVFELIFTGDLASWHLDIETASGERFTPRQTANPNAPLVSAMAPGTLYDGLANIGEPPVAGAQQQTWTTRLAIEPNWELTPNETLIFTGALIAGLTVGVDQRFLAVGVHVWEFPGMLEGEQGALTRRGK